MSKSVNCKKCGQTDLVWAKSKAGKFYLAEPDYVSFGERQHKMISFAHKCSTVSNLPKSYNEIEITKLQTLIDNAQKVIDSTDTTVTVELKEGFVSLIIGWKQQIEQIKVSVNETV
jgi:hypothetical protein